MTTDGKEQTTNETPMNSGADRKPHWTAEERLAFRILGRIGYEGDLLRVYEGDMSETMKGETIGFLFDLLVEEISAGIIGLGMTEWPLDKLASAAESYEIAHRKADAK